MRRDVLEEFAEVQSMIARTMSTALAEGLRQPLASIHKAYRARQRERGLCRSCARLAAPNRASCDDHLHKARLRAYASQGDT